MPSVASLVLGGAVGLVIAVTGLDAASFHEATIAGYKTPWFSEHWWQQPYTHARLAAYPAKEYWTKNYAGTERWLVREHDFQGVKFWTVIERTPVPTLTAWR